MKALSIVAFLVTFEAVFSALDCPILYHGIKDHSACVPKSADFVSGEVSEEDKKLILEEHNRIRGEVKPPACNMLKLYWNDDLAYVAQKWARNCKFDHDKNFQRSIPGSFSAGQNLGKGFSSWKSAIKGWADEVKDFTYDGSNQLEKVGHYTQVVTEKTATIGCGFAECKGFKLYVCNYGPGGNVGSDGIKKPWKKCDKAAPLRDCKGKFCKNWGTMKEGTCECDCKDWKHIYGPDCSTNCSVKDSYPCGEFYTADKCPKYSNVPPQCPWTCHTCPYLDNISSGAAALKYSVMSVLPLMILFMANWLFQ